MNIRPQISEIWPKMEQQSLRNESKVYVLFLVVQCNWASPAIQEKDNALVKKDLNMCRRPPFWIIAWSFPQQRKIHSKEYQSLKNQRNYVCCFASIPAMKAELESWYWIHIAKTLQTHTLTKVHMGENSTHNAQEPSDKINPTEIHWRKWIKLWEL